MGITFKLDVEQPNTRAWHDLTGDVVGDVPMAWGYGIRQGDVFQRTGGRGELSFSLDNDLKTNQYSAWWTAQSAAYPAVTGGGPYIPNQFFTDSDGADYDLFDDNLRDADNVVQNESWFQVGNRIRLLGYEPRAASGRDGAYVGCSHAYSDTDLTQRSIVHVLGTDSYVDLFSADLASDFDGTSGTLHAAFGYDTDFLDGSVHYLVNAMADTDNYVAAYTDSDSVLNIEYSAGGALASIATTNVGDLVGSLTTLQVTILWDATLGLSAYVNGVVIDENIASGAWAGSLASLTVGASDTDGTNSSQIYACGVSLWSTNVTRPDFLYHPNESRNWHPDFHCAMNNDSLLGYWPMNEGSGTTAQDWGQTPFYFKFFGRVSRIEPPSGKWDDNRVKVSAVDWMEDAANHRITNIPPQVNVTMDEALQAVVSYSPSQPMGLILTTGADTFAFTSYDTRKSVTVLSEITKLAASELGYAYMRGTVNSEGIPGTALTNESRHSRLTNVTSSFTITDDASSDVASLLSASQDVGEIKNEVEITTHPADADTDFTVVSSLPTGTVLQIDGGKNVLYTAPFLDPDNAYKTVGVSALQQPVRNTDFVINSAADGGGADLTADYRQAMLSLDSANLLIYLTLQDSPSGVFRNEVDINGGSDVVRRKKRSSGSASDDSGSPTGGSGGSGSSLESSGNELKWQKIESGGLYG